MSRHSSRSDTETLVRPVTRSAVMPPPALHDPCGTSKNRRVAWERATDRFVLPAPGPGTRPDQEPAAHSRLRYPETRRTRRRPTAGIKAEAGIFRTALLPQESSKDPSQRAQGTFGVSTGQISWLILVDSERCTSPPRCNRTHPCSSAKSVTYSSVGFCSRIPGKRPLANIMATAKVGACRRE